MLSDQNTKTLEILNNDRRKLYTFEIKKSK